MLPRVFELFFTTKPLEKNSGLGLTQVFGFARQSGGGVELAMRVGEGTSVKVFLPRSQAVPTDPEPLSIDPRCGSQTKALATIMVVDDDAAVLKTTLRSLDALGFATVPAASGMEALQLLESGPEIDLVLADFAMPEMNGVELARAIKIEHPALLAFSSPDTATANS